MRKADALIRTAGAGFGVGACLGMLLAWMLFVEHPLISHMIASGPSPEGTLVTLCGVFSSVFAVCAALTAVTIDLLTGG